jgi:CDP-4-dehydro-6-deoxyglucose reductase
MNVLMPVARLTSGAEFDVPARMSILEAAYLENVLLPYSCKTGRCGSCRCKVKSGKTSLLHPESGLTEAEMNEGWILSCVHTIDVDVLLEVDDLSGVELPVTRTWPCRIHQINRLAPDVVQVFIRLPPACEFHFLPGQYIEVIGPNSVRRSYSLANSNFNDKLLELHIRRVDGGIMSDYWFNQAASDDLLRLTGPLGTFFLRDTLNIDLIFLATGTGIAPIKSMLGAIEELPTSERPNSVTVLWGGRNNEDFYLDIATLPGKRNYIPVISRPDASWSGESGYVQDVLISKQIDLTNAAVYACGSDAMIHEAKQLLLDFGLLSKKFYSDAFVSSGNI